MQRALAPVSPPHPSPSPLVCACERVHQVYTVILLVVFRFARVFVVRPKNKPLNNTCVFRFLHVGILYHITHCFGIVVFAECSSAWCVIFPCLFRHHQKFFSQRLDAEREGFFFNVGRKKCFFFFGSADKDMSLQLRAVVVVVVVVKASASSFVSKCFHHNNIIMHSSILQ